jgi:hypothetical protein
MQVQKDHIELSLVDKTGRVRAFCKGQRLYAGGSKNSPNEFADRCFIINDEASSLHVILHFRGARFIENQIRASEIFGSNQTAPLRRASLVEN